MGNALKKVKKTKNKKDVIKKKPENTSTFNAVLITIASVLALAIVVATVVAVVGGIKKKNAAPGDLVSVKSEHFDVTNGMLSYYLYSSYYSALNQNYYSYAINGLDISKSLKNQNYSSSSDSSSSSQTWFDYFLSNAVNEVSSYLIFAERAYENGVAYEADVESSVEKHKKSAEDMGVGFDEYLEFYFGEGFTEKDLRDALVFQTYATDQYDKELAAFTYDDSKIEEKYNEDPTPYQYADYRSYKISADYPSDESDTEGRTAAEDEAKAYADAIAEAGSEDEFIANVLNYLTSINDTLEDPLTEEEMANKAKNTLTERSSYTVDTDLGKWLFTEGRKAGDTAVIPDSNGGFTACYVVKPIYRLEYNTKTVRHILIKTDADTEDETDDAKAKADEVYDLWNKSGKTEDDFIKLADEYNEDSKSLYENIFLGEMVSAFESWCFDESRKPGDCEIVETEYGYHIIYFVSDGEVAWKAKVISDLKTADFQTLMTDYQTVYQDTISYDRDNLYKLSGFTAYSRTPITTASEESK